ncbi:type II toxin-antitoxin system RelE/ParE family toxin [Sporomusa termitida]|uniref:ParE toxin of type II toxin-antitoxin system, parDE n=1 Tax=Sporomusa termitida TaxID=2377 RepID=A0A517DWV5_9FIRM|nr:type II toxin-antitoxin system RelE/ParE family toxin [Sporomusa termitida]QDR81813.1 hypothetical protein SPTER_32280 [Sporomusa termitida]
MGSENRIFTVVISEEAAQMLVSHARFLAQVSEAAAARLIEDFQSMAKSLEQFPERNPSLIDPLITPGKYRKLLLERYLLIYQIKGSVVCMDAIVNTRQNYGWLL